MVPQSVRLPEIRRLPLAGQMARHGPPRRRPAAGRLAIEALEDRCVPASLTVSDVSILEGNVGTTNALVTVRLSAPSSSPVTVNYSTANGTALAGSDYQAVSGTLTFAKGQTSKSILVPVIGDRLGEPNETFFVNLSGAKKATIADGQGVVTIVDDDTRINISDVSRVEGNSGTTEFKFTVTLAVASTATVTVNYATANGTATAGSDYVARTGTLTIPAGQTSGTITVLVNGDRLGESDETFFVNLSSPTNATIADGQGAGSIVDDEPRISIGDVSAAEGNSGTTAFTFTVTLSAPSDAPVTVDFATANDTATSGSDYVAASGTLSIPAGQTSGTITVLVNGDRLGESDETLFVNLSSPTNAVIADGQGAGSIVDDEPRISIGDVSAAEGNSGTTAFTFTVTLSAASDAPVTVNYATANDTATSGSDYVAASGTLSIPAGQTSGTITVLVNGDRLGESDETFFVNLSSPTNAFISAGQGVGSIVDDEPRISIGDVSAAEGNSGTTAFTFTVTLSAASDAPVTVDFAAADGTATTVDNDYVAASGTLTFAPGETSKTITVLVSGDLLVEYDEYFVVNLSNATNALLSNSQALGTIQSDDNAVLHIGDSSVVQPYPGATTYISFTVWLSAPFTETVTVDYYTVNGSATAGYDYYATSGTLTFGPGQTSQTFSVQVLGGYSSGYDKTFYVNLNGTSSNALIQPGWGTGTGTIYDNYYYYDGYYF